MSTLLELGRESPGQERLPNSPSTSSLFSQQAEHFLSDDWGAGPASSCQVTSAVPAVGASDLSDFPPEVLARFGALTCARGLVGPAVEASGSLWQLPPAQAAPAAPHPFAPEQLFRK